MERRDAIDVLARHRGGAVSIATMQSVRHWHDAGQADELSLDATGCMGSASSIGLGLAMGRPDRKVLVLDGDGSLLMQLGTLVTIAAVAPRNLYHFVFVNGLYESTGNQPIPGQGMVDFCGIATSAGYPAVHRFDDLAALDDALPGILAAPGPALIELAIDRDDTGPRWPRVPMAGQIQALRAALGGES